MDVELLDSIERLLTLLKGDSKFDLDLQLAKEIYFDNLEKVYKNQEIKTPIKKSNSVNIYDQEKSDLQKYGSKMREKILSYKRQKSVPNVGSRIIVSPSIIISEADKTNNFSMETDDLKPNASVNLSVPKYPPTLDKIIESPTKSIRAVSSFGLEIEEPVIDSQPESPVYTERPPSPAKVENSILSIPANILSEPWFKNIEASINIVHCSLEATEQLVSKSNISRIYSGKSSKNQQEVFSKFIYGQTLEKNCTIAFTDAFLGYLRQYKDVIPKEWLNSKRMSLNIYSSLNPFHQEIIQLIVSHINFLSERFPSESIRIAKAFAKVLTSNDMDMEFLKSFFLKK
eukprot:NODE_100_length_20331_cov_1.214462.p8 type:complete len:343 gc:universal NODE_100_length_20331_cov_1.214462:4847-3819(-)